MSLSYDELETQVKYLVGDPQGDTFSPEHYSESIDFAIKQYANKTGVTYVTTTASLDALGQVNIPTDYLKVNRVTFDGNQLIETTLSFIGDKSATWSVDSGTVPKRWAFWSGSKLQLFPLMGTASVTTPVIGYTQKPAVLSGTDTVDDRIPSAHNEYLKYAAASYLFHLDGDSQSIPLADKHMDTFNQLIGYNDPVLQYKQNLTRKTGKLEV